MVGEVKQMKYKVRRVVALLVLIALMTVFTSVALRKGIDAEFERQDKVLENHFAVHGVER